MKIKNLRTWNLSKASVRCHAPRGYLMLLAIVFGAIFLGILSGLSNSVLAQNRYTTQNIGNSEGFALAEAGLEYYAWHLAHFPTDLENGTGQSGPYVIPYNDPEGGQAGTYTLSIAGNTSCNELTSVDITSKGVPADNTGAATLFAHYGLPSVALYNTIVNASVWAGSSFTFNGPYHSNGGIRMDGNENSPVTSSLSSWLCTSSFGCSTNTTEPGVFGSGSNQDLWSYPTPQIDFNAIAANFSNLKSIAQSSGLYLPRFSTGSSGSNASHGYHLIFNSNGTVTIYKVTDETNVRSIPVDGKSNGSLANDYSLINTQSLYSGGSVQNGTYTLPPTCGLIFVEDNAWIEGVIPSQVTVVAANVTPPGNGISPNIYLPNNITYSNPSGVSGLTAIAANDVLITPDSPQDMVINGIYIAQGGAFGRNYYGEDSSNKMTCPNTYEPRTLLTIHGTIVSNLRTGTEWLNGCNNGTGNAGYLTRVDSFDRQLSTNPPAFTPTISTVGQYLYWHEK